MSGSDDGFHKLMCCSKDNMSCEDISRDAKTVNVLVPSASKNVTASRGSKGAIVERKSRTRP